MKTQAKAQTEAQVESARWEHLHRLFQEVALAQRETERLLEKQAREAEEQRKREAEQRAREAEQREREAEQWAREEKRRAREADKRLNKLESLFTSQWGKLVESLVEGDLIPILNERRIRVEHTVRRAKGRRNGQNFEFDIIAVNGEEVVIVEVKTTLRPKDVRQFVEKLARAKEYMPQYAGNTIYGAMAWLRADANAEEMAEKQGLFVIRATGKSASILNDTDFTPRGW